MAQQFEDFFGHNNPSINVAAHLLHEIQLEYQQGAISTSEFKELSTDVLELELINKLAADIDNKIIIGQFKNILAAVLPIGLP